MNNLSIKDTMSSREIAQIAGRPHNDVLKSIRKMERSWRNVTGGNFSLSEYTDSTGRKLPEYQLTKTECLYIATKFNDEARARLVLRWEALENERLKNYIQIPKSIS
ncbi:Rha family transcriptional regulator, partial [Ornithobacterium rhinotracheale]